jgi:hypothetical protein
MNAEAGLAARLRAVAERSVQIKGACTNEESTKHYLVLPVLVALGYTVTDPYEVQPEFAVGYRASPQNRIDYAILSGADPLIAVECRPAGGDLVAARGQLRGCFNALPTVKLGIATDGLRFELFVDAEAPGRMDEEPFLTLDIASLARGAVSAEVIEALEGVTKARFDAPTIATGAELGLVQKRLRAALVEEVRAPSEEFCRLILQRVGAPSGAGASAIQGRAVSLIRAAYEEAIVRPVLERLRAAPDEAVVDLRNGPSPAAQHSAATDRALAIYHYVCRRLAFLVTEEHQFQAIEQVQYREFLGRLTVFYGNLRTGRLFDFIEGGNGTDTFVFPDGMGEIVTGNIAHIDEPLRIVFTARVRELGADRPQAALLRA